MFEQAQWIWKAGERRPVNEHVLFRKAWEREGNSTIRQATLCLSADTRYRLWVNGVECGEGPIRSTAEHWYYDTYEIAHLLKMGTNAIVVKVWHYGHSNYQYVENEAGLIAQLTIRSVEETTAGSTASTDLVIGTDESWLCLTHPGYVRDVVKRNVNIGWMEIFDANPLHDEWMQPEYAAGATNGWEPSVSVAAYGSEPWGELHRSGLEPFSTQIVRPKQVVAMNEIIPIRQVVSVNMRDNLYPAARDANAKVFSAFMAVKWIVPTEASGRLTFAHSRWNGVQGRFKIDETWYTAGEELRLSAGEHLFLLEICGVHNDLLTHMELDFDVEVEFAHPFGGQDSAFVTIGPFETIEPYADGYKPVYGGVEKSTGLDHAHPMLLKIGACSSLAEFAAFQSVSKDIESRHVLRNQMIYSLMMRKQEVRRYPITAQVERLLHDHARPTELPEPAQGGDLELLLDFGKIYVGTLELELEAAAGTVMDVYGFENRVGTKNAYTSGCNNSFRYICRDGRQTFRSGTRMGFRYLIVTVRRPSGADARTASAPVRLHGLMLRQSSYPATDKALFRCSDPLLNDIWEISRHTSQMCMEDTFVDCPTYEQVFWVGDCRVSALVNYQLFGSYELVRHCLEMVPRSRKQSPLLLALLPTDWQAAIPMWTFSWIIACREYVAYSGDRDFLEGIYPEIRLTLEAYRGFLNAQGLFDTSTWNMLDWAPIDIPYVGVVTAQQAQLAQCHRIASDMATALGLEEEASELGKHAERLKQAIQEHLWDEEDGSYLDGIHRGGERSKTRSLQTHVLLYLADCLGERQAKLIEPKLLNPPADWVGVGSPFFSFYLFEVWQRHGELDRILAQIRTDWGKMIRYGATTTWETFPVFPRSHAHAWSAAPAFVLGDQLLGVRKQDDGWASVRISPPKTELLWAEGSIPTPYGRIDISWSQEEEKRVLRVSLPAAIEADLDPVQAVGWDVEVTRL